MREHGEKHGKPVFQDASAETEGVHQAGGQDRGVSGVAVAQGALERRDQFEAKRVREPFPPHRLHLVFVERPDEDGDRIGNPVEQLWKDLKI